MITIAELRARNNKMSQSKLAEELNVDVNTVYRWKRILQQYLQPT